MQKYSEDLKLQIVLEHKYDKLSSRRLSEKYHIHHSQIEQWIAQFSLNGKFTKPTGYFSAEFKLKVLNYQQEHKLSDIKTALLFGITDQTIVYRWRKKFISGGEQAIYLSSKKEYSMPKKSLIPNKPREEWTEKEELEYLRMENAYLKKYMALVQDEEKQQQKKEIEKSLLSKN